MPQTELSKPDFVDVTRLNLDELATICSVPANWLTLHIQEGLLEPLAESQDQWYFSTTTVLRVRRMLMIERDFEAVPELAALVADLQEEIARLKHRLNVAGIE